MWTFVQGVLGGSTGRFWFVGCFLRKGFTQEGVFENDDGESDNY